MMGGVRHQDMRAAYLLADITLIPTFAYEATALAAIESLSLGRPVVCTNIGGLNDVVRDDWNGLVVQPRAEALARAIVQLTKEPALRTLLGENGRAEAALRFSLEAWRARATAFATEAGWVAGTSR